MSAADCCCRGGCNGVVQVQIGLYAHLQDEQDAQHFVAGAVVAFGNLAREDVAEAYQAFGEVVVGAGKVKGGEGEGVDC
jgi:hypothetical protein